MEKFIDQVLDQLEFKSKYLSQEFDLIRPDFDHCVAGILPEMMNQWNADINGYPTDHLSSFPQFQQRLEETYPSGYDNILLILVDGIGAVDLQRLGGLVQENISTTGMVGTSTYPTITSTVMTSILYGTQPAHHGVVGYNIYNEFIENEWNALRLRYLDENQQVRKVLKQVSLDKLVEQTSMAAVIDEENIPITYLVPEYLRPPGLGNILLPTFEQNGYSDHDDALQKINHLMTVDSPQKFVCLYLPEVDSAGHGYGPDSVEYAQALSMVEQLVAKILELPVVKSQSTLTLLTSDHGLVPINRNHSRLVGVDAKREWKDQGTLLSFSGRVIHAYATDGNLEKTHQLLERITDPRYTMIIEQDEAIAMAGGKTSFANRMGDFNIISSGDHIFQVPDSLATQDNRLKQGHHGSLSARELFVPIAIF